MKINQSSSAICILWILIEAIDLARIELVSVLTAVSRFAVCAATGDLDEVFELVERHRPELVVADPFVNSRDGTTWTKDFVRRFPKTKLFVASWNLEENLAERINDPKTIEFTFIRQAVIRKSSGTKNNMKLTNTVKTISLVCLAFTCASGVLGQGTWTPIAPMPIGVSFGANGVAFGGKLYVFDGTNGTSHVPQVYNPATDSWSVKAADPVVRSESAAGVIGNKIYVAEGWLNSDSNNSTTALEIYYPSTDTWAVGAPSLVSRGLSATAVIDGKLYVAGGTASQYVNFVDLEIYDPLTNTWSKGASLPEQLTSAAGAALNGKFYVLGGYTGPSGYNQTITAAVQVYDPALNIWSPGTSMPRPRANTAVAVINSRLFITGGNAADGSHDPSVLIYDPVADKWHSAAAEPTARSNAAAAAVGFKLFVAGGNTDSGPYTTAAEVFTLTRPSALGEPTL